MSLAFVRRPGGPFGVLIAVFAFASTLIPTPTPIPTSTSTSTPTPTPTCETRPADGDPVGTWKLSCVCPDGKARDCVILVSREGQELKATYRADGVSRAARAISFDQGILSVKVDGDFAGSKYVLTYRGRPGTDSMCGDVGWSYLWASGSFTFKGERIVEDEVATR